MSVSRTGSRFKGYRNFEVTGKDSNFLLLVTRYWDSVQDDMKKLLQSDKGMSQKKAQEFMDKFFTLDNKRMKDVKKEVAVCYSEGFSSKDCAKQIIKNYYNITKVNKYKAPMEQPEVTEVSERKTTSSFYHFKHVSESLFWNFISRVNKLDVKFVFDTSYINKLQNSLNFDQNYPLYMETPTVTDKAVEYEFVYSKLLSSIMKVISSNKYQGDGIKFFIAIDKNKQMRFGYVLNEKRYTFGGFNYKSNVIARLAPYVKVSNGDIDLKQLSVKFKTSLWNVWYYRTVLKVYLDKYDDINIYISVINNKLAVVVDSEGNDDVLNKKYIENMLIQNLSALKKEDFYVNDIQFGGKIHYYIIIK